MPPTAPLPPFFVMKKARIIASLSLPASEYDDLSPKGFVDERIRDLIEDVNAQEGWVTTSSCAGRVSVFVEGRGPVNGKAELVGEDGEELEPREEGKDEEEEPEHGETRRFKAAGAGGKGGGGKWLFVSHEAVPAVESAVEFLGMHKIGEAHQEANTDDSSKFFAGDRLIHFKFEPMILHVLTASLAHAQNILSAALQAGFRESGALNLVSSTGQRPTPMVAVRSTGLALDSIVGRVDAIGEAVCITSESYLRDMLALANGRFAENSKRINRFRDLLLSDKLAQAGTASTTKPNGGEWEDKATRRERMRAEGLKKREELMRDSNCGESLHADPVPEDKDEKIENTEPKGGGDKLILGD